MRLEVPTYRFEIWHLPRTQCCRNARPIPKPSGNSKYKSRVSRLRANRRFNVILFQLKCLESVWYPQGTPVTTLGVCARAEVYRYSWAKIQPNKQYISLLNIPYPIYGVVSPQFDTEEGYTHWTDERNTLTQLTFCCCKRKYLRFDLNLIEVWFVPSIDKSLVLVMAWHDDVIKWKHFPRYWPFVRGIHRSPVNSLHKG